MFLLKLSISLSFAFESAKRLLIGIDDIQQFSSVTQPERVDHPKNDSLFEPIGLIVSNSHPIIFVYNDTERSVGWLCPGKNSCECLGLSGGRFNTRERRCLCETGKVLNSGLPETLLSCVKPGSSTEKRFLSVGSGLFDMINSTFAKVPIIFNGAMRWACGSSNECSCLDISGRYQQERGCTCSKAEQSLQRSTLTGQVKCA